MRGAPKGLVFCLLFGVYAKFIHLCHKIITPPKQIEGVIRTSKYLGLFFPRLPQGEIAYNLIAMALLSIGGLLLSYLDLDTAASLVLVPQIAGIGAIRRLHVRHQVRRAAKGPIADRGPVMVHPGLGAHFVSHAIQGPRARLPRYVGDDLIGMTLHLPFAYLRPFAAIP